MDQLSDDVLLTLFAFLDVKDLVRLSRVCRRWFKTVQDVTLWRQIQIRAEDFPIDRKFAHLIRSRCFPKVESLRIEGFLKRFRGKPKATHPVLTRSLLELLAEKTPNLRELIATDSNLENVSLNQFPQSLEALGFPGSIFAMKFLNPLPARFPNLTSLDVSDSISISSQAEGTVDAIFRLKSLKSDFISMKNFSI